MTITEVLEILWQFFGLCVGTYWLSWSIARGWKDGKGKPRGTANIHQIVFKEEKTK
jgi:hypothetical protein